MVVVLAVAFKYEYKIPLKQAAKQMQRDNAFENAPPSHEGEVPPKAIKNTKNGKLFAAGKRGELLVFNILESEAGVPVERMWRRKQ